MINAYCLLTLALAVLPYASASPVLQVEKRVEVMKRQVGVIVGLTSSSTALEARHLSTTKPTPTPTTSQTSTSTTVAASSAVATKTIVGCNIEGTATPLLLSYLRSDNFYTTDPQACQLQCMRISQCEAYSWQDPGTTGINTCLHYMTFIDETTKVTPSNTSGIYFSDKYPSDGSNYCYGNHTL